MTALDEILFVADGIEPLRKPAPAIEHVREMVARGEDLDEVYAKWLMEECRDHILSA